MSPPRGGGEQAEGDQVVEGLGHRAGAERGEPAARRADVGRGEHLAVALAQGVGRVGDGAAVPEHLGGDQDVEEAVHAAALGVVAHGAVQAGGALERGLAVQGRIDPGGHRRRVGHQVVVHVAQPQLEPEVGRGHLVGGGEPGGRGPDRGPRRGRVRRRERALVAGVVERGHHPADVAGGSSRSRSAISSAATSRPSRAAAPRGPATWPAPPVTTTESGAPKPRTSGRSVSLRTKLPTRSAYHSSRRAPHDAVASWRGTSPGGKMAASSTRPRHWAARVGIGRCGRGSHGATLATR